MSLREESSSIVNALGGLFPEIWDQIIGLLAKEWCAVMIARGERAIARYRHPLSQVSSVLRDLVQDFLKRNPWVGSDRTIRLHRAPCGAFWPSHEERHPERITEIVWPGSVAPVVRVNQLPGVSDDNLEINVCYSGLVKINVRTTDAYARRDWEIVLRTEVSILSQTGNSALLIAESDRVMISLTEDGEQHAYPFYEDDALRAITEFCRFAHNLFPGFRNFGEEGAKIWNIETELACLQPVDRLIWDTRSFRDALRSIRYPV